MRRRPTPSGEVSSLAAWPLRALVVVVLLVASSAAASVATQAARASSRFGPVEVSLDARAALRGDTRLQTVLGDLVLDRHLGPAVGVTVSELSVQPVLAAAAGDAPVSTIRTDIDADRARQERVGPVTMRRDVALVARFLTAVFLLAFAAAFLTSATSALLLARRGMVARPLLAAVGIAAATAVGLVGAMALTRSSTGEIRTGWLAYGTDRADVLRRLDEYDEQYAGAGRYVLALLDSIDRREAPGPEAAACLVAISDIHSRNVMPLVRATIEAFPCTVAVVDAGDAVDWGSRFESEFIAGGDRLPFRGLRTGVGDLGVPYLVVQGNHDSARTMAAYRTARATVLDGSTVTVGGLRVVGRGQARPADAGALFTPDDGDREDEAAFTAAQDRLGRALLADAQRGDADVAVVHHPRAGRDVLGSTTVVVTGHTHRQSTRVTDGSFHLQLGSIGGAGLRAFDGRTDPRRQDWAVLRFDRSCRFLGATLLSADSLGSGQLTARDVDVDPPDRSDPAGGPGQADRRCG